MDGCLLKERRESSAFSKRTMMSSLSDKTIEASNNYTRSRSIYRWWQRLSYHNVHLNYIEFGFMPGPDATGAIFILHQLQGKSYAVNKTLYWKRKGIQPCTQTCYFMGSSVAWHWEVDGPHHHHTKHGLAGHLHFDIWSSVWGSAMGKKSRLKTV